MITGAARAAVPVVAAVAHSATVSYAEVVTSVAARSAGPEARSTIDAYIESTCAALTSDGGAQAAKAILVLNPADPPVLTRYTVYCLVAQGCDAQRIESDVLAAVQRVRTGTPGYRLARPLQFEDIGALHVPGTGGVAGIRITALLEVRAAPPLPEYAGELYLTAAR